MPLPPLNHDLIAQAFTGHLHAFGSSADADEAFDDAVASPLTDAAFTAADPSNLRVAGEALTADQAVAAGLAWLAANPDSAEVAAFGIVGRAAHTRKTRRIKVEGADLEVPAGPGARWLAPAGDLAAALAAQDGYDVTDAEVFETVEYTRRARYKPIVTVNRVKSAGQFIAVCGTEIVATGQPTAGAARRAAVALLKEKGKDDHELTRLDVYKLAGREGNLPLLSVARTRISQVIGVKLVHATPKSEKTPKTVGWLFVAHPPR